MHIGIFDSGLGGLSVLRAIRASMPDLDISYLADQANLPYGSREPQEIQQRVHGASRWLMSVGCDAVVLACNTATAAGIHALRRAYPEYPFVGMEPAIKPAAEATRSGVVGVLATPGTLSGQHFQQTRARHAAHVQVIERGCPGWVEAVETGLCGEPLHTLVANEVEPLVAAGADWLVLGCTHFPFLADTIAAVAGPAVSLLDPAPAVARQLQRLLQQANVTAGQPTAKIRAYTTGEADAFLAASTRLLGAGITARPLCWSDYELGS